MDFVQWKLGIRFKYLYDEMGHQEFHVNPKISENLKVLAVVVSSES
jgi:hypothetical protein